MKGNNMNILQALSDLIKSGEGSRGGSIIGHTASGKAIYGSPSHSGHNKFDTKDHRDAAGLHEKHGSGIHKKLMTRTAKVGSSSPSTKDLAERSHMMNQLGHHHRLAAMHHKKANSTIKGEYYIFDLEKAQPRAEKSALNEVFDMVKSDLDKVFNLVKGKK